jgi:pimeloyl-ACP methyl ester carboxylesterase
MLIGVIVFSRCVGVWLLFVVVVARSYVLHPGIWKFRGQHPIAYETAKVGEKQASSNDEPTSTTPHSAPVLLLNGFGVGSFHQHRLVHQLLGDDTSNDINKARQLHTVYCMDYLGQGKSWPQDCNDGNSVSEKDLRYCGTTWVEQIINFIEEVILPQHPVGTKIHLAGNSVGGHLATFVAAIRPDLVQSLTLMNATPVWGLNLPGWSGHLPAPWFPKVVGRYLFDQIRDLRTIKQYLVTAYGNPQAFDEALMQSIRDCTTGTGGHAAFASILWSPPVSVSRRRTTGDNNADKDHTEEEDRKIVSFYDALSTVECDVLLLFGAKDPWCKPALAKKMLQRLQERPAHLRSQYVEIEGVGVGVFVLYPTVHYSTVYGNPFVVANKTS